MIKILENKSHVVSIYEEIIEIDQKTNEVLNYLVVVEEAIQDMEEIVNIWILIKKDTIKWNFSLHTSSITSY